MDPETTTVTPDAAAQAADPSAATQEPGTSVKGAIQEAIAKAREGGIDAFRTSEEKTERTENDAEESQPTEGRASEGEEVPASDPEGDDASAITAPEGETTEDGESPESQTEDTPSELIEVAVPGRRDGETVTIQAPDQETADLLRQLANNGMRRAEFNRQSESVRQREEQVQEFVARLETDAPGLILERATPDTRKAIVREILFSDETLLREVAEEIIEADQDPAALNRVKTGVKAERVERENARLKNENQVAHLYQRANAVIGAVNQLIPEGTADETADAFYQDALDYLEALSIKSPDKVVPQNVAKLLESRLRLHGITVTADGSTGSGSKPDAAPKVAKVKPVAKPVKAPTSVIEEAKQTGKKLAEGSQKRRSAITAPAGAGAESTSLKPPAGQNVKQRLAWLRNNRRSS